MRLFAWGITALLGTAGISALLAQTIDGLDVQAIKKRSADLAADAQAFVDQVKDRGDEFREEAVVIREAGTENMRQVAAKDLPKGPAGPIDFDEIVQGASKNASAKGGDAPQFIAFASLSMPQQSLKQLIKDTARAGGVVVFRGFPNNSMKAFAGRLGQIVESQDYFTISASIRASSARSTCRWSPPMWPSPRTSTSAPAFPARPRFHPMTA